MDKKTMGAFLSALRKANGYTQQEVADRLNVSNKTVSKWERDEGCPEIMMLPAIAELYGVTVDELLRGERIVKEETPFKEEKTEKQAKYIFSKAQSRFNNLSVIAVSLGVIAAVLSYLLYVLFYSYITQWVGIILTILIMSASVITEIIAFNNFTLNFDSEENFIDEKEINKGKRKALICLGAVVCLGIVSVVGIVFLIANVIDTFVMLPVAVLMGGIVACLIYWLGGKKMGLEKADKAELSPEFIKYRRKHINVTAIVIAAVMSVSFILPFIEEYLDYLGTSSYGFYYAVGYGIETEEEAEHEYYKLKNFYENGETLYVTEDTKEYTYLWMLSYSATATHETFENGVSCRDYDVSSGNYQGTAFESAKELKEFEYNHCWDMEILDITKIYSHVSFDDETLTVSWRSEYDVVAYAIDALPEYLIFGSCIAIFIAVVSYIAYYRKKKLKFD